MTRQTATYRHARDGIAEVKVGFSWPAFFFGALWAAAKRMWFPEFLLLLAAEAGLWFVTGVADPRQNGAITLIGLGANVVFAVVCGRYGNRWLAASLLRRGYQVQRSGSPGN